MMLAQYRLQQHCRLGAAIDLRKGVDQLLAPAGPVPQALPVRPDAEPAEQETYQMVRRRRQIDLLLLRHILPPTLEQLAICLILLQRAGMEDGIGEWRDADGVGDRGPLGE